MGKIVNYLIFIIILISNSTWACICANSIPKLNDSIYKSALIIFVGRVVIIDEMPNSRILKVRMIVTEAIKNSNNFDTIDVLTNSDESLCGLRINTSEKWYFFINKKDNSNFFWEDICGRSIKLSKNKYSLKQYGFEVFYYRKVYRKNINMYKIERRRIRRLRNINKSKRIE